MISVQNHRQRLNGSRVGSVELGVLSLEYTTPNPKLPTPNFRLWFLLLLAFITACSPKTTVVKPPAGKPPVVVKPAPPKEEVVPRKRISSMALILPFELDKISGKNIQQKDVTRAALAIDFYQGFKMALDSVAEKGNDFRLEVLDSRDNTPRAVALSKVAAVKNSDIIIGPVFPDGIRAFSQAPDIKDKLQVSPLAAAMPTEFNNPKLVSMNNSIDQHAWKLADFIGHRYRPDAVNVIIVNPRKEDDENFAAPVRKYLASTNGRRFTFTEVASVGGAETKLSSVKTNAVIITSFNNTLVLNGISRLYAARQKGKIEVYGHPNWAKLKNLDIEKLQGLNTRITSSYYINYKSPEIMRFVSAYKIRYQAEPSEFAFKGFDTGFLFGSLLARYGKDYAKHLTNLKHNGLHNDFQFTYDPAIGYTNKNLMMLRYEGFEMRVE